MTSPTQRQLTDEEVKAYARQAFPGVSVIECKPLGGGTFAAVWRVGLSDGRDTVLKVGPPPQTPLLTYEADMIASEAAYYRLVRAHIPDAPVPTVLYGDKDFLFVTYLPGTPLSDQDDDPGCAGADRSRARQHPQDQRTCLRVRHKHAPTCRRLDQGVPGHG